MCPGPGLGEGLRLGGESSVYLLNCSVCKGEFNCRYKWMEHLTLDGHQNLARECLLNDVNNLRECSLVIFTTYDLNVEGAGKIIQYFGRDQMTWVTDFLWWEDRPRVAVVQFESRKKVDQVVWDVESFSGDLIQIDDTQGIQVKGAFNLLDLEWKAILPGSNPAHLVPRKSFQKFTKESEESFSAEDDKHRQVSNCFSEETLEEEDDNSSNYVKRLFDLAEERQWEPPNFKYKRVRHPSQKKTKYIYTVHINGKIYKPNDSDGLLGNREKAKQTSAKNCLETLESGKEDDKSGNISDGNSAEDNDSSSPVDILRELSQKHYGTLPTFKSSIFKTEPRYLCRVILKGRVYKPRSSIGRSDNIQEALRIAAQYCLEKLKEDYGIAVAVQVQENSSLSHSQLSHQFKQISKYVEIPDKKCKQTLEIVRSFRDVLRKRVPSAQVIVFRNWYLKLRNSALTYTEYDPLFVYIYAEDEVPDSAVLPSEDNFNWIPGRLVQSAISQFNDLFQRLEITFPHPDDPNETRLGCKFLHKPSGFPFVVVNFKRTMVEVQCSRLVKYFCEFDPRIRPLLILAKYWSITNGINWGEREPCVKTVHRCLPEPHPLEWMILTFLMWEKYVPSLRTILERPHKVIMERATVTDVGFTVDMDYARKWKQEKGFSTIEPSEQLMLSTLQLFQNFLEFCCTQIFDRSGVIINPKDGEILETEKFLSGDFSSELTADEIAVLKQFQENSDNDEIRNGMYCVDFKRWHWYMINPLVINWRCSVPTRNQELVTIDFTRKTNQQLKKYLKLVAREGAEKAFQICGASLCETLKVDREAPDPFLGRSLTKRTIDDENPEDEGEHTLTNKRVKITHEPLAQPTPIIFDLEKCLPPPKTEVVSLAYQLYSLLEEFVVIPNDQFGKVLQAVNFLQKVFFYHNDPTCKVSLFRSWNLKLKCPQEREDMPVVYAYNRKPCEEMQSGFTLLPPGKIWAILKSREVARKINILEGPTSTGNSSCTGSKPKKRWTLKCWGFGGDCEEEVFNLSLVNSHVWFYKAEVCGLLEYMCKFDWRAYQMIKMAYLWMTLNELSVGDEDSGLSTLQWLVIFWMCHRKMVPSPREIQGRENHKVMRDGRTGVDFGWQEDKEFLEEWRGKQEWDDFKWEDDCVENLLEMFREFLDFCGGLVGDASGGSWILNTRHGELIEMKRFLNSEPGDWAKSMSEEEMGLLRNQVLNVKACSVYMSHPFNLLWRFGLGPDFEFVLKLMKVGGTKLKKYLNMRKSKGKKDTKKKFKTLRNVLTLTDVDANKIKKI